jgi:O-antigen/teichoic acid export membrane protein
MRRLIKEFEVKVGSWSLFDQGAVSLGSFLTQMLLARNMGASDYGVFALLYGVLFFLIGSLGTVVTYPLSLKGGSADRHELRRLTGASLWFQAGLVLPEALIVLCAVVALHNADLFLFAVCALFSWQFQETLRRALMARLDHRDAIWGDALSYIGQALAIAVLARTGSLTPKSAFLAIAITSAAAAVIQALQVKPCSVGVSEARVLAAEYWRLGSWASSTSLANGVTQQAFPWVLGLLFGTAEAGSFQAILNPLKIFNPLIVGTQNIIVPAAAKERRERGIGAASRGGLAYAVRGSILFLPYLIVLFTWPRTILGLLYGFHSPYVHLELAMRICVVAYAIGFWGETVCSLLNGLGLPRAGFVAQLSATGAAVGIGVPLTLEGGLIGAIVSLGICAALKLGIALPTVWAKARTEKVRTASSV